MTDWCMSGWIIIITSRYRITFNAFIIFFYWVSRIFLVDTCMRRLACTCITSSPVLHAHRCWVRAGGNKKLYL